MQVRDMVNITVQEVYEEVRSLGPLLAPMLRTLASQLVANANNILAALGQVSSMSCTVLTFCQSPSE